MFLANCMRTLTPARNDVSVLRVGKKAFYRIRKPPSVHAHIQYLETILQYFAERPQQHGKHSECGLQLWKGFFSLDAHPRTIRDPEARPLSLMRADSNAAVLIHLSGTLTSHQLYLVPL